MGADNVNYEINTGYVNSLLQEYKLLKEELEPKYDMLKRELDSKMELGQKVGGNIYCIPSQFSRELLPVCTRKFIDDCITIRHAQDAVEKCVKINTSTVSFSPIPEEYEYNDDPNEMDRYAFALEPNMHDRGIRARSRYELVMMLEARVKNLRLLKSIADNIAAGTEENIPLGIYKLIDIMESYANDYIVKTENIAPDSDSTQTQKLIYRNKTMATRLIAAIIDYSFTYTNWYKAEISYGLSTEEGNFHPKRVTLECARYDKICDIQNKKLIGYSEYQYKPEDIANKRCFVKKGKFTDEAWDALDDVSWFEGKTCLNIDTEAVHIVETDRYYAIIADDIHMRRHVNYDFSRQNLYLKDELEYLGDFDKIKNIEFYGDEEGIEHFDKNIGHKVFRQKICVCVPKTGIKETGYRYYIFIREPN